MFGLIKGLMGSVNLWFLLAVAAAGFSAGAAVTYPLATWKERAQWTAPMKEFADARSADLAASEAARAAQALEFTQAVRDVALKNQNTQLIVSTVLDNIGGLKDEIGTVRARLLTLPVGSCVFTVDADSLRGQRTRPLVSPPVKVELPKAEKPLLAMKALTVPRPLKTLPRSPEGAGNQGGRAVHLRRAGVGRVCGEVGWAG